MARPGPHAILLAFSVVSAAAAGLGGCTVSSGESAASSTSALDHEASPDASASDASASDASASDASASDASASDASAGDAAALPRGPSTTGMAQALADIGLDVNALPPLHDLPFAQKLKVMRTFNASMGVECTSCHDPESFAAPTPRKEIASFAWEAISRRLTMKDGGALYCDSCHYGTFDFLDRSNLDALRGWMKSNYVDQLRHKDGSAMSCTSCHATAAP